MGAYGGTAEASMSGNVTVGKAADVNNDGEVNIVDVGKVSEKWLVREGLLAEDVDRDGEVELDDVLRVVEEWLWQE
jgi:hypothetical protein